MFDPVVVLILAFAVFEPPIYVWALAVIVYLWIQKIHVASSAVNKATLKALGPLDNQLIDALRAGHIRLLRPAWLLDATLERLPCRQDLEAL